MPVTSRSNEPNQNETGDWTLERLVSEIDVYVADVLGAYPGAFDTLHHDRLNTTVSRRLYRAGGYCHSELGDPPSHKIVVSYPAYRHWGWSWVQEIVRHELCHAVVFEQYGTDVEHHGSEFRSLADRVGAPLKGESPLPPRFELRCSDCERVVAGLYEASDRTADPSKYRSDCCSMPLVVDESRPTHS